MTAVVVRVLLVVAAEVRVGLVCLAVASFMVLVRVNEIALLFFVVVDRHALVRVIILRIVGPAISPARARHVALLMGEQVAGLAELFLAGRVFAYIGLFSRVDPEVRFQIEVQRKVLAANITLKGLFSRVHEPVPFQLRVVHEPLSAPLHHAHVGFLAVNQHVLFQGRLILEHFPALAQPARVHAILLWRRIFVEG